MRLVHFRLMIVAKYDEGLAIVISNVIYSYLVYAFIIHVRAYAKIKGKNNEMRNCKK